MTRGTIAILSSVAAALAVAPSAPAAPCAGQNDASASPAAQERAMRCLVNRARVKRSLNRLAAPSSLARAAARKSADILRCDEFSYRACGRDPEHWVERSGYDGCAGENIAFASGDAATPRFVFRLWMNSRGHRGNILGRRYDDVGIGLRVGDLEDVENAHVWTQSFGIRGC